MKNLKYLLTFLIIFSGLNAQKTIVENNEIQKAEDVDTNDLLENFTIIEFEQFKKNITSDHIQKYILLFEIEKNNNQDSEKEWSTTFNNFIALINNIEKQDSRNFNELKNFLTQIYNKIENFQGNFGIQILTKDPIK